MTTYPAILRLFLLVMALAVGLTRGIAGPASTAENPGGGKAAKPAAPDTKGEAATPPGLEHYRRAAARYAIELDSQPPARLALREEPVLHWANPLRKTGNGAVFLWLDGGRPAVIASFYTYRVDGTSVEDHEFESLAITPLTATNDGRVAWAPKAGGISWQPIPGAPAPAATPATRVRQMQTLAREFRAFFDGVEDKTELRLLSRPLYRYQTEGPEADTGALFAFVQTTDPEVLLLIESRPNAGTPAWHYGFARMSMVNLRAKHKDKDVWVADWDADRRNPSKPYVDLEISQEPR
jgi:hypothetical protein